jgi:hypothetical protein
VADGWCWFVLREEYCWLVVGGWCVMREKYCWLVADKPSEQGEFADGGGTTSTTLEQPSMFEDQRHRRLETLLYMCVCVFFEIPALCVVLGLPALLHATQFKNTMFP